jgi:hypothetical protein
MNERMMATMSKHDPIPKMRKIEEGVDRLERKLSTMELAIKEARADAVKSMKKLFPIDCFVYFPNRRSGKIMIRAKVIGYGVEEKSKFRQYKRMLYVTGVSGTNYFIHVQRVTKARIYDSGILRTE